MPEIYTPTDTLLITDRGSNPHAGHLLAVVDEASPYHPMKCVVFSVSQLRTENGVPEITMGVVPRSFEEGDNVIDSLTKSGLFLHQFAHYSDPRPQEIRNALKTEKRYPQVQLIVLPADAHSLERVSQKLDQLKSSGLISEETARTAHKLAESILTDNIAKTTPLLREAVIASRFGPFMPPPSAEIGLSAS